MPVIRFSTAALISILCLAGGCHHKVISDGEINKAALLKTGQRVSQLRGLEFIEQVNFRLVGMGDVARTAKRGSFAQRRSGKAAGQQKLLSMLGLIPLDVDTAAATESILTSQPAGLYKPGIKRLELVSRDYVRSEVIETISLILGRDLTFGEILAHELVHTLQDQHFGLEPPPAARNNQDAELAHIALAEGDATLIGFELGIGGLVSDPESFFDFARRHAPDMGKQVPSFLKERFKFPYLDGSLFVLELKKNGGLEAINKAFLNPPLSSEQVLHPEKYILGNDPPRLPNLDDLPGVPSGYTRVHSDTLGEFGIRALLQSAWKPEAARRKAAGWGGDRAVVFEKTSSGELIVVWVVDWDTPADAADFFDGLDVATSRRFGQPDYSSQQEVRWQNDSRFRHIEIWDKRVVFVDAPADVDPYLLVAAAYRADRKTLRQAKQPAKQPVKIEQPKDLESYFVVDQYQPQAIKRSPVVRVGSDSVGLTIGALLQVGGRRGDQKGIAIQRMRARARGYVTEMLDLNMHLELEFNGDEPILLDAAISFSPVSPSLLYLGHFWIGRFRTPCSDSILTDPENLFLIDRPLVVQTLAHERRPGLMYDLDLGRYAVPVRIRVGAFDGFPEGNGLGPLTVVRLDFNPGLWLPGKFELSAGSAYSFDKQRTDEASGLIRNQHGVNIDLRLGYRGYSIKGEYIFADRLADDGLETRGWSLTAGAFLLADFLQIVGRYEELWRPSRATVRAAAGGLNFFYLSNRFRMSYNFFWRAETGLVDQKVHLLTFQLVI
jgi:hypothetical protein